MRIRIFDYHQKRNGIFIDTLSEANIAIKAMRRKNKYEDIGYHIVFDDGEFAEGLIDMQPRFHHTNVNTILTDHIKTFWGNIISKFDGNPKFGFTQDDVDFCKKYIGVFNEVVYVRYPNEPKTQNCGKNTFNQERNRMIIMIDSFMNEYAKFTKKISLQHWRTTGHHFTELRKMKEEIPLFSELTENEKIYLNSSRFGV